MTTTKEEPEELNLDKKVTVRSIAGWNTTFARRTEIGDVMIAPLGNIRLSRNEIIAQVQNGNKLFTGMDGMGSHATLYIDDEPTRIEVGFESEDGKKKQEILNDDKIKDAFKLKTLEAFKRHFTDAVQTRAEKYAAIEAIKRLKFNDYDKIRFVEEYTGYKL